MINRIGSRLATACALLAAMMLAPPALADPTPAAPGREVIVISDLHFGVGRTEKGNWDVFEDFRWAPEFALFLDAVDRQGGGKTDLVINGDGFELWQSHDGHCPTLENKALGCTETEALARLQRALEQHRTEIKSLSRFAKSGDNRVIFVPGNHDGALLFPKLQKALLAAFDDSPRVKVAAEGTWLSSDGAVFAEHGHMIGEDPNRFLGWPQAFVKDGAGVEHLHRPWGEQFVVDYYNQWELKYPIIDNLSEETYGARLAMSIEGVPASLMAIQGFGRFFVAGTSNAQLYQVLGAGGDSSDTLGAPGGASKWNLVELKTKGPEALAALLSPEDPLREAMKLPGAPTPKDFTDAELRILCEQAAATGAGPCPHTGTLGSSSAAAAGTLGSIKEGLVRKRSKVFKEHLTQRFTELRAAGKPAAFKVFVFSHTHAAESPWSLLGNAATQQWNPTIVNSGAWQRIATPKQLKTVGKAAKEQLGTPVERLPACYTYIRVPAGGAVELKTWQKTGEGWGSVPGNCDGAPMGYP